MTLPAAATPPRRADGTPPRVVVLVDNDVRRDSRVQKQARSLAALGWEVTVLGLAQRDGVDSWQIGGAQVQLLQVHRHRRPHEARSARWRNPFAYATPIRERQRLRAVERRNADISLALGQARSRARSEGKELGRVAPLGLLPRRVLTKVTGQIVARRSRATNAVREKRRQQTAPVDRLATWWHLRTGRDRAWRRLDTHLWDFEATYGPAIDALAPDLIHANDFRMLGVGARAKMRAVVRGEDIALIWDAHEFLPGAKPWNDHPRWHVAQMAHENEFAGFADSVVTVSAELAEMLQERHGLARTPDVVLNCPALDGGSGEVRGIRDLCGLPPDTPLLVYSGSPSRQRGLGTVIDALVELPDVHCALVVAVPDHPPLVEVLDHAAEVGVRERVHLLPYVAPEDVVAYLSSADAGLIPIDHVPNHEIALITKFFEYSHARLPIVVSDVRAMSGQVRATGQGEVFTAGDAADLARALRQVIADPQRYRSAYEDGRVPLTDWTWDHQAQILDGVYRTTLASLAGR